MSFDHKPCKQLDQFTRQLDGLTFIKTHVYFVCNYCNQFSAVWGTADIIHLHHAPPSFGLTEPRSPRASNKNPASVISAIEPEFMNVSQLMNPQSTLWLDSLES
jgi:hypothetical protein